MRPGRQRVGRSPRARWPHRLGRRQAQGSVPPPAAVVRRQDRRRLRLRPRHAARSADRPGRRVRRGDERRQLQHHGGARRRARPSRSSASSPASTTPAAPRSTSASASRPSRPSRGPPTRCCAACCPATTPRAGPTRAARSRSSNATCPPAWAGRPLSQLEEPGRCKLVSVTRLGTARIFDSELVGQEGDILHLVVTSGTLDELQERLDETPDARQDTTDARRDRGRGQRRLVHRARAGRATVTTCCCSRRFPKSRPASTRSPGIELRVADACEVNSLRDAKVDTCDVDRRRNRRRRGQPRRSRCSRSRSSRFRASSRA